MTARLLHQLVARQAQLSPEAAAVVDGDTLVSYADLDRSANQLAGHLADCGVGAGDLVGIWLPKSTGAIVAMQAVLRRGAAYIPLDSQSPLGRIQRIVSAAEPKLVIAAGSPALGLPVLDPQQRKETRPVPVVEVDPESAAYVLYTSGTTGVPKGVCISHRAALAFVNWAVSTLEVSPSDRLANHAPFHFDLSVLDLYAAFASGAAVVLVPESANLAGAALVDLITLSGISIWYSVPSALILMMEAGLANSPPPGLRAVLFAGEVYPPRPLRELIAALPGRRLLNLYGPTETNVCAAYEVGPADASTDQPLPLGWPCCGNQLSLRSPDGALLVRDGEGEICVTGPTCMTGYRGEAPLEGPYHTGDLARQRPDGALVFVGRRDHQVKVRGHRVQLGEIEAVLAEHPDVAEVCVLAIGEGMERRLVAFVSPMAVPGLITLKQHCAAHLPRYQLIDAARRLPRLPRTRNGKIDRAALLAQFASE